MDWHDLLFLHWRLPPDALGLALPDGVQPDLQDGSAWVSLVAFHMSDVRLRSRLGAPGATAFPELNLRTYVQAAGRPAIWFLSLDATSRIMVELLRRWFRLPYLHARATVQAPDPDGITAYRFERRDRRGSAATFEATARPRGSAAAASPDSLDHFLVERYTLATADGQGRLRVGHVRHAPYPLQAVDAAIGANTLLARWPGLDPLRPDRASYARHVDVRAWTLEPPTVNPVSSGQATP